MVGEEGAQRFRSSLNDLSTRLEKLEADRRKCIEERAREDAERLAQQDQQPADAGEHEERKLDQSAAAAQPSASSAPSAVAGDGVGAGP